jgi:hypothetical protein
VPPLYRGFTITIRQATLERTPLDQRSTRRRDLYLITHTTNKKQTSVRPVRFEPSIPASERPQAQALVSVATGIGTKQLKLVLHPVQWCLINIPVATIHTLTSKSTLILSSYLRPCLNVCSLILWGFQTKLYMLFSILPSAPNGPPITLFSSPSSSFLQTSFPAPTTPTSSVYVTVPT